MKNISFDNPWLLLLMIPLALAVIIPYFIAKNKDNRGWAWTVALFTHLAIIILVCLAAAGLSNITVLTKTEVYVVADVSYSADRSLDEIDARIAEIKKNLPDNSTLGVICFGKNSVMLTPAGRAIKSVSEAEVDNSATDIVKALTYTEQQFSKDCIKRIVLITDGNDTTTQNTGSLAATVERMTDSGIKIDAIFLDSSPREGETEVQLMEADLSASCYTGQENEVKLLIQSSVATEIRVKLFSRPDTGNAANTAEFTELGYTVLSADAGLNTVRMSLPNDTPGSYEYRAVIEAKNDISEHNNTRTFVQTVVGDAKVLLITGKRADADHIESLYAGKAEIDAYVVEGNNNLVPFILEDLIQYDEIIISNIDIRDIRNANAFVDSLDMAVSQYGKSLITLGDLHLQTNSEDQVFQKFAEILPVTYGTTNREGRMYTIVLDISYSMYRASKFTIATSAATQLLSILEDEDYVTLVTFSGNAHKVMGPVRLKEGKDSMMELIAAQVPENGTDIGLGLEAALNAIQELNLAENHVMIISDGIVASSVAAATVEKAAMLYQAGATVSVIHPHIYSDTQYGNGEGLLKRLVNAGEGGHFFQIQRPSDVDQVMFGTVADEIGEVIITKDAPVNIARRKDDIVNGITALSKVSGYVLSVEKYDATVPLTITHIRDNGYQETVPLYAYRAHGNGRVASFTANLATDWTGLWSQEEKTAFFTNLIGSNTPSERLDRPFTFKLERTEYEAYMELVPSLPDLDATMILRITDPKGITITRDLAFDSQKYFYTLTTTLAGTYRIDVTYTSEGKEYTLSSGFDIPFLPEYNAFASFDRYHVYEFIRDNGSIVEDGIPDLENDLNEVDTYKLSYAIPLLIAAIVIFAIDIFIRKLRLSKKRRDPHKAARKKGAST